MSIHPKYKVGDKINNITIIGEFIGERQRYLCECKCGNIIKKNTRGIKIDKFCIKCPDRSHDSKNKYHIGDKINECTIVDIDRNRKNFVLFHSKCSCGLVSIRSQVQNFICKKCKTLEHHKSKIGKIYGCFKVINVYYPLFKTRIYLEMICINCGEKYSKFGIPTITKSCKNCVDGYHPGKIIDGMTLIERVGKGNWNIKCECGKIFKSSLQRYNDKLSSCGCRRRKDAIEKAKQKIGLKFGCLKIINLIIDRPKKIFVNLKCICGKIITRPNGNEFKSKSCGCKWHGHSNKGEASHWCKLTDLEVLSLKDLYNSKCYSIEELMKIFDLSKSYLIDVIKGKKRKI